MDALTAALEYVLSPLPFGLILLGTALGIIVGAIPGLTGAMLIALALPLTFTMDGPDAMILLISMYVGSISGGLITATLLRMPGTPASIMTTLDGYPMAQRGEAGRALGLGISASFVGGIISWLFLILLSSPMADLSTRLGPFDFFSLVLMALVLIASVSRGSMTKAIFAGFLGILAALPGVAPSTGQVRLTLGFGELNGGLHLLPVLIGLFAVTQVIEDILRIDQPVAPVRMERRGIFMRLHDWKTHGSNLVRSSLIGTWVGILPGIGANVGSILAYSTARSFSKKPDEFGQGCEAGVVASEAANNATVGGALIPLFAMGIPGSVIDAILLGALVVHGLQPGPLLFQQNPQIVYSMMAAVLLANVAMFVMMLAGVGVLAKLMVVPRALLIPAVLTFCVVGSYAISNRMFDVWVMLAFGLIGLAMQRLRIPLAPFVIGFVLAPLAEEKLAAGLMTSGGSYLPIITRPLSATFFVVSMLMLLWPLVRRWREKRGAVIATPQ